MQPRTIRQIHAILRTALGYAIKWGWIDRNPAQHASPPKVTASEIHPPDPAQAARLVETASKLDRELGVFVWLAMVTGARRGELCALRWTDVRVDERDLLIARSYVTRRGGHVVKDTKTHQRRRLALDAATVELLTEHRGRCAKRAEDAGLDYLEGGYVFSRDGFGEEPWLPDTTTHQFQRAARKAGVSCRLHDLRHYTATQLIGGGVDLRDSRRAPRPQRRRLDHTQGLRPRNPPRRPTRRRAAGQAATARRRGEPMRPPVAVRAVPR